MSIDPPKFPSNQPHGERDPMRQGPEGKPGGDFGSVMNPQGQNSPAPTPLPLPVGPAGALPVYTPPPIGPLKKAPKPNYPQVLNGKPNAQYYFHFNEDDVMTTDPYPKNPPDPNNYQLYPKATITQTPADKNDSGFDVAVVSLPIPYKDPRNPSAKYYNWNYMYVKDGKSNSWSYCGNGPSLRLSEIPMDMGLWQKYFPWENVQFILNPEAQQILRQQQQMEKDRARRKKIYSDEAGE